MPLFLRRFLRGALVVCAGDNRGDCSMGPKEPPQGPNVATKKTPVDVLQVSGSMRWFDTSKGYGFIIPASTALRVRPLTDATNGRDDKGASAAILQMVREAQGSGPRGHRHHGTAQAVMFS
jgi:hypothetical protein